MEHFWRSADPELPCPICGIVAGKHDPALAEMGSWVMGGGDRVSVSDCAVCGRTMLEPGRSDYPVMEVGIHEACAVVGPKLIAAARAVVDAWADAEYLDGFDGASTIPALTAALEEVTG